MGGKGAAPSLGLPGDLLPWAYSTSIPAGVALAGAFAWSRRVCWLWTGIGALLLDTACLLIKDVVREPRPVANAAHVLPSEGEFGMPAEHAAFAFFLLAQLGLRLLRWARWLRWTRALAFAALAAWACAVAASRHRTGAHSAAQLAVGAAAGVVWGVVWTYLERRLAASLEHVQMFVDASYRCLSILYGDGKVHDE